MARTTIRGGDLEQVLTEALANILESGDDIEVRVALPEGANLDDITLKLEAAVSLPGAVTDDNDADEDVAADTSDSSDSSDSSDDSDTDESEDVADESSEASDTDESSDVDDARAQSFDGPGIDLAELEDEADAAADFIEGVLDAMDLPGDLRIRIDEVAGESEVELVDIGTGALIGRRGQTLEALQELLRCSMQREFERRSRVKVDIEGYRARRLEKLIEKAEEAIDDVLADGEPVRLEPMDVFERKAIHRLVGDRDGVSSRSQGREPGRRVVVEPA